MFMFSTDSWGVSRLGCPSATVGCEGTKAVYELLHLRDGLQPTRSWSPVTDHRCADKGRW